MFVLLNIVLPQIWDNSFTFVSIYVMWCAHDNYHIPNAKTFRFFIEPTKLESSAITNSFDISRSSKQSYWRQKNHDLMLCGAKDNQSILLVFWISSQIMKMHMDGNALLHSVRAFPRPGIAYFRFFLILFMLSFTVLRLHTLEANIHGDTWI